MAENTMVEFSWLKVLEEIGRIQFHWLSMQERRDNASPRLFHDTIQLLQQLLLFATNAIIQATSTYFTCHGSSKFISGWLGNSEWAGE